MKEVGFLNCRSRPLSFDVLLKVIKIAGKFVTLQMKTDIAMMKNHLGQNF